jgi:hypothetical protein
MIAGAAVSGQSASLGCATEGARTSPIGVRASVRVRVAPTNAIAPASQHERRVEVAGRFDEVAGHDRREEAAIETRTMTATSDRTNGAGRGQQQP